MACFIVPAAEAIVTTVAAKAAKAKETEQDQHNLDASSGEDEVRLPFVRKVKWLTNMLWGGSALLAFEHIWHGEVTPWFPFLTAASNPADTAEMLHEMATVGVSMAALITVVWVYMVAVSGKIEKRADNQNVLTERGEQV
jgi:hypothetical protein